MNRFIINQFLLAVCCFSLIANLSAANNVAKKSDIPNHAVILQYHHVSNTSPASTSISIKRFAEHMEYLADNGYQVKSLAEVVSALQSKAPNKQALPDKTVVITFDDAYQSIYKNAYPLLKDKGWPFTVFVNSTKTHRNRKIYLGWDRLREMAQHGAIIANHTPDHSHMLRRREVNGSTETTVEWLSRIEVEITDMQAEIVKNIGEDARFLAYPYGEADVDLRNLVKKLGFVGLGQHSGPIGEYSDFTFLPRFPMSGIYSGLKPMKTKLRTLPFPITDQALHQPVVAHGQTQPELAIKLLKGNYRLAQLACYASENGRIPADIQKPAQIPTQQSAEAKSVSEGSASYRLINVKSDKPIIIGRSRYNCTAPHTKQGRYYWYSAFWYRMDEGERWIDES